MMRSRRLLLSVLLLCPILAQTTWNTRGNTSLSEFSLLILGHGRFLDNYYDDDESGASSINEQCSEYLVKFLEGTTDAKDTCDGIQNAYMNTSVVSL